jgi:hypothetical protein
MAARSFHANGQSDKARSRPVRAGVGCINRREKKGSFRPIACAPGARDGGRVAGGVLTEGVQQ